MWGMSAHATGAEMSAGEVARRLAVGLFGLAVLAFSLILSEPAKAEDVKLGILVGVTGKVANFVPPLLDAARLAVDEVNTNGGILKGQKLETIIGDTQGTAHGGVAAATKLVKTDDVVAIVGANTSSATIAAAHAVTVPNGVLLISPSATATVLTTMEDKDFVFRVAPSDADQGWVLARLAHAQGVTRVAVTYVDTDYGAALRDTFSFNFENFGGEITFAQVHEANKTSYIPELTALAQYNPEALVVVAYAASGGATIIKQALANGFFKQFIGTYSMMDPLLIKEVGADKLKGMFFTAPTHDPSTSAAQKFEKMYNAAYKTPGGKLFIARTYDAVMLTALAIEQAGSTDRTKIRDALRQICCAPGEVIEPGEWAKAKADIAAGKNINYEGASGNCDFDEYGDVKGVYGHYIVENGTFKLVELLKP
jgi:branched-chain amino acid transport system substrate-binding protein